MRRSVVIALVLAGCGPDVTAPYIALTDDFADFQSWEKLLVASTRGEAPHELHDRYVWVNRRPGWGDTEFPVGTMIVKGTMRDGVLEPELHAMVKRGGDFNPDGAHGWEWFELEMTDLGVPAIAWRGANPGADSSYGASGSVTNCNACHGNAAANDYVQDGLLRLAR